MSDHEPAAGPRIPAAAVAATHPDRFSGVRPEHLYKAAGLVFLLALLFKYWDKMTQVMLLMYAAAIIAVGLNSAARRLPLGRKWVAALIGLLGVGAVALLLWVGIPLLSDQVQELVGSVPKIQARVAEWEAWIRDKTGMNLKLPGTGGPQGGGPGTSAGQVATRALGFVEILFVPVILFFGSLFALANPNERLLTPLLRVVNAERRPAFYRIFQLLGERLRGWLKGTAIAMVSVGLLSMAVFSLIGVPSAIALGLLNGLVEFVPLFGPWVGGGTATLVAFTDDPNKAIWTAAAAVAIQQVEANIITPWAMSSQAEIHPFVTLFGLVLFGGIFGFLGLLLALPLTLLVWTIVQVLWVERALDTDGDRIAPVVEE